MQNLYLKSVKSSVKHWYVPFIVGLLFVIVSIIVFSSPMSSFLVLALLFSLTFIFGGVSEIIFSIANRGEMDNWGWSLTFGAITLIVGVLLLLNPSLSATTLAFYIGFVILFRSIAAIGFAMDMKKYGKRNWGWLLSFGVLGIAFSFLLLSNPLITGMSIVVLVALSFLMAGLFNIHFSLQLRKLHKSLVKISEETMAKLEEAQILYLKELND